MKHEQNQLKHKTFTPKKPALTFVFEIGLTHCTWKRRRSDLYFSQKL